MSSDWNLAKWRFIVGGTIAVGVTYAKTLRRRAREVEETKECELRADGRKTSACCWPNTGLQMLEEELVHMRSIGLRDVPFGKEMRQLFRLDPHSTCINHGSYGAAPVPVVRCIRRFDELVASEPDKWYRYQSFDVHQRALRVVAPLLKCDARDLVFVNNATSGVNAVVESLDEVLKPGDTLLAPSLLYNAVNNCLESFARRHKMKYVIAPLKLPFRSKEDILTQLADALREHTNVKLVLLDHITSATAVVMPLKEMTALCHEHGAMVLVDGAHAIGQTPIDVVDMGVDFYTTNCHKWLFASQGSALLYCRKEHQSWVRPNITSHCYKEDFQKRFWMQATTNQTMFVSIAAAAAFYQELGGLATITAYSYELARWARDRLCERWGTKKHAVVADELHACMILVPLPVTDKTGSFDAPRESPVCAAMMERLIMLHRVIGVVVNHRGRLFTRLSCTVYNTREDYLHYADVLDEVMEHFAADLTRDL